MSPNEMSFFEQVYAVVRLIPPGRVSTYGAIARYLGTAGSSRMVGWAMNNSHGIFPPVPAHRVVNRNGMLTGKSHFGTAQEMENRLMAEGIIIENDQVKHFSTVFWDPGSQLLL
jgi:methylated-DNA-protein-cysteine methyltransferase related protein